MSERLCTTIPVLQKGQRLDTALVTCFPQFSRSQLSNWLKAHCITVDGDSPLPKSKVKGGEAVILNVPDQPILENAPESIGLDIVYEDDAILVINKPKGLIVHPGAGHPSGTLLNALLNHDPNLACLPRSGIVHRLDKDTTGLMVVAKTHAAQTSLVSQLQARTVSRIYEAIAKGVVRQSGVVDQPIGRHPTHRQKMAIRTGTNGKVARTHFKVLKRFKKYTHVELRLETGRTHQIRVHMASLQHPLVGDITYGWRSQGQSIDLDRQALHARTLSLCHPVSNEILSWSVALPEDIKGLLNTLQAEQDESLD
ncbi:MAG: 23S rRNA pseudouridine(1911/1915/1917) synthase RluD [Gammaproteobacteria bacterium]